MATVSPPKPWERAGLAGVNGRGSISTIQPTTAGASSLTTMSPMTSNPAKPAETATTPNPPPVPDRPSALNATVNRNASTYATYPNNRFSTPYTSPYNRLGYGGYNGGGMYGGSYNGMYGSSMYGPMGMTGGMGMGMGMGGMGYGGDPNDPNAITSHFTQSTAATFAMIENLVGAFTGFAQMLESTYMATHSSFFAMLSVADQFSNLRNTLGSLLGIFTLMRWLRTLLAKVTGRPPPQDSMALTPRAFARFQSGSKSDGPQGRRLSKKPFLFFMAAAFGLPYLLGKLIRALAASQEEEQRRRMQQETLQGPNGIIHSDGQLDPSKLDFCRLLYDFSPPGDKDGTPHAPGIDIVVKKGDLVAVLSKMDPTTGAASEWWQCRTRDGRIGYLPAVYLEDVRRNPTSMDSTSSTNARSGKHIAAASTAGSVVGGASTNGSQTTSDAASRTSSLTSGVSSASGGISSGRIRGSVPPNPND